jgi:hypothetical protein
MQGSITLNELGIFIVFALIVVTGGYAIMTLRNINGLIKEATVLLQKNKEHFNQIIPTINVISEDTEKITKELKKVSVRPVKPLEPFLMKQPTQF